MSEETEVKAEEKTDHKGDRREAPKRKITIPAQHSGRKFWSLLAVLASSTVAVFTGHVDPGQWLDALIAVFGIYVAGNTAAKFQRKK